MIINLFIIKVYLMETTKGIEFLSFYRGKCLFGVTWDKWEDETILFIDLFYKNIFEKGRKKHHGK